MSHEARYLKELADANRVIEKADALIRDSDGWTGVDPGKLSPGFLDYYSGLLNVGYANGFI